MTETSNDYIDPLTRTTRPSNVIPLPRNVLRILKSGPEPLEKLRAVPRPSGFSYLNSAEMVAHGKASISDVMIPEIIARNVPA